MLNIHDQGAVVNGIVVDRYIPDSSDDSVLPGKYRAEIAAIDIIDGVLNLSWKLGSGGHVLQKINYREAAGRKQITALCVAIDDAMIIFNIDLALRRQAQITVGLRYGEPAVTAVRPWGSK